MASGSSSYPGHDASNFLWRRGCSQDAQTTAESYGFESLNCLSAGILPCQMEDTTQGWQQHEMVDFHGQFDGDLPLNKVIKESKGHTTKLEYMKMFDMQGDCGDDVALVKMAKRSNASITNSLSCKNKAWLVDVDMRDTEATLTPHVTYQSSYAVNTPYTQPRHGGGVPVGRPEIARWPESQYNCGSSKNWSSCSSMAALKQGVQNHAALDLSYGMHGVDQPGGFKSDQEELSRDDAITQANMHHSLYPWGKTARKNLDNFLSTCSDKENNGALHAQTSGEREAKLTCNKAGSQKKAFSRDSRDPIWTTFQEDFYLPFPIPSERIGTSLPIKRKRGRPPKTGSTVGIYRTQPTQSRKGKRRRKAKLLFSRPRKNVHVCLQNSSRLKDKGCDGKLSNLLMASTRGRKRKGQTCRDYLTPKQTAMGSTISYAVGPSLEDGSSRDTGEFTDFGDKLEAICQAPFDMTQLVQLVQLFKNRKPIVRLRNTRQGSVFFSTEKEGLSYLDHHPDLAKKLESTSNPEEKLRLLRGFFFWIQHSCMPGSFKPWTRILEGSEDDDCVEIEGPDCEVVAVVLPVDEHQNIDSLLASERYQEFINSVNVDIKPKHNGPMEEHSGISVSSNVKVKLEFS
ncbi:hypothetical protein O6H91_15G062300 [Diphasiastrum complanatum]|uniref:Uncharacterized protein n=4 Tax=Diphasiastrum complanatum TaxID=34168 RepID=A0ACC2BIX5_DIPCM|nr:hypothetical protein O6H91_15G062300 [Diphasiastrum complanatum]KAJ7529694.1 hypothetical protein O6H91_15G062300 [Diphasiastrum complanatum]KAJ7529695.1 hypothetical protein O6H91_15G062300 [Diphasiastrum complanatum]KAJ7529696.1 hypothetical protein O6H91_15G062300 [Diphasiastrum complanatum]